jgi:hypothetical protein
MGLEPTTFCTANGSCLKTRFHSRPRSHSSVSWRVRVSSASPLLLRDGRAERSRPHSCSPQPAQGARHRHCPWIERLDAVEWTRHRRRVPLPVVNRMLRRQVAGVGREAFEGHARGLQCVTWTLHRTLERMDRTLQWGNQPLQGMEWVRQGTEWLLPSLKRPPPRVKWPLEGVEWPVQGADRAPNQRRR